MQPHVLGPFTPQRLLQDNGHCRCVNNWKEYLCIYWSFRHYLPRRSTWFLALVLPNKIAELWRWRQHDPSELPELRQISQDPRRQHATATQPTEPEIRQQKGLLTELSNFFVAVVLLTRFQLYSHSVIIYMTFWYLTCFSFRSRNFYS